MDTTSFLLKLGNLRACHPRVTCNPAAIVLTDEPICVSELKSNRIRQARKYVPLFLSQPDSKAEVQWWNTKIKDLGLIGLDTVYKKK